MKRRSAQAGLSLIETVIGLALGLIALLVIVQAFTSIRQFTAASSGQADAQQRGTIASWRLLRELRMAGAGIGHGPTLWGCRLNAWRDGVAFLPRPTAWPAPFDNLPTTLRLVPIAVSDDTGPHGSDQLLVMTARGAAGTAPATTSVASGTMVRSGSTAGYRVGDLLLMTDATSVADCQVGQVDASYLAPAGVAAPSDVPTGAAGTRYNAPTGFSNLPQPGDYSMINLGSTPTIQMIGIDDDRRLLLYDAMGMMTGADPVVLAENVHQLQVLYGLDDGVSGGVANDNVVDRWVSPGGAWAFAAVHSAATNALAIKAIRIAIVTRSATPQGRTGPATITLFEDLPAASQVTITPSLADRQYQFQIHDSVIALRNETAALCAEHRRLSGVPAAAACD
ncbi:MAG: PilW family protein [Lautropia sp.]